MRIVAVTDWIRRHRLTFISFITGFSLLTFELAAARILAPSIGSSTYVWTGVIGVIIAALSLGFIAGGKVADARYRQADVVWLLLLASGAVALTLLIYQGVLNAVVDTDLDSRIQAVIAAFTLFAPASFFIGMTSPYLAKLNVRSLGSTGRSIASLDAYNALGGITGTFVTGFILFGYIGSHEAIGLVVGLLLLASWLVAPRRSTFRRIVVSGILLLIAVSPDLPGQGVIKIDTASAHYQVVSGYIDNDLVTGLITGPTGTQSAVYQTGVDDPVFWYNREIARIAIERRPERVLILGGGAFTLPQYLAQQLPDSSIDVVEIDPELEAISKQYFGYTDPSNVREIFTDARTYVNRAADTYDVIVVDVYGDTAIPFSLMTREYGRAVTGLLAPEGVLLANIIGGTTGSCRPALAAVDAAYRAYLPSVVYSTESGRDEKRANHVVVYSRSPLDIVGTKPLSSFGQEPYGDDFAPAERLYYECRTQSADI